MSDSPSTAVRRTVLRRFLPIAILLVLVLAVTPAPSFADEGYATWYGQPFHGRYMYSGKIYDMYDPTTTAANIFPIGTWLKVTNPANGRSVVVQVRDRGAFKHALDLSYAAFKILDNPAKMMIKVRYEVVTGPEGTPAKSPPAPAAPKPAPKPTPAAAKPAAKPTAPPTAYVVQPGDSLGDLAARFGIDSKSIVKWNDLADPDQLVVGQRLQLRAPASASTRGEAATSRGESGFHVVAQGDSLSDIAARYGTTVQRLMELNDLSDPDTIVTGHQLRLPQVVSSAAAAASGGDSRRYVVKEGDTLWGIAEKLGTTATKLIEINGLTDSDLLQIGQVLAVP